MDEAGARGWSTSRTPASLFPPHVRIRNSAPRRVAFPADDPSAGSPTRPVLLHAQLFATLTVRRAKRRRRDESPPLEPTSLGEIRVGRSILVLLLATVALAGIQVPPAQATPRGGGPRAAGRHGRTGGG